MSIQFASDLHQEFYENRLYLKRNPLQPKGEILVLGGDILPIHQIGNVLFRDFFSFCADHFEMTYWIAGNHEYYYDGIDNYNGHFVEKIRSNVHLVNNHVACHYGAELILSTLWTRVSDAKACQVRDGMNDYRLIQYKGRVLTTGDTNLFFEENRRFIVERLGSEKTGKRIVVTHHVPTFDHYPPEYLGSDLNQGFAVDLNEVIQNSDIDDWVFGHHHRNMPVFTIGNTRMVTNQMGYTWCGEQNGFNPGLVIGG